MFTGLVEGMGEVLEARADGPGQSLRVRLPFAEPVAVLGASIAVNGVCLTVFQVGPETLALTNLGRLKSGDRVNLERSLRLGDPMGGHWVQGHVDGTGAIASRSVENEWEMIWFDCPVSLSQDMIKKGSVAVDGVSLTLVDVRPGGFQVMLIPHTLAVTTLGTRATGEPVNIEVDILARHVRNALVNMGLEGALESLRGGKTK
jgi:riboflavin synthase